MYEGQGQTLRVAVLPASIAVVGRGAVVVDGPGVILRCSHAKLVAHPEASLRPSIALVGCETVVPSGLVIISRHPPAQI